MTRDHLRIIDDPLLPPLITDDMRQQVHDTDDPQMEYELMRAYHRILTDPAERASYLEWLERNDVMFAMVKRCVLRETGDIADEELFKTITIVLARHSRQLVMKGAKERLGFTLEGGAT